MKELLKFNWHVFCIIKNIRQHPAVFNKISMHEKILLVDNDIGILESLKEALKNNYCVITAKSGEDAVTFVKREIPNLIILDIKLGGINGLETLKIIKNIAPTVPIIMLSVIDTLNTIIKSIKLGAHNYFDKPFDINELKDAIKEAIEYYPDKIESEKCVLPSDIELFIQNIVADMVEDKMPLSPALKKFNQKYINFVFNKFRKGTGNS